MIKKFTLSFLTTTALLATVASYASDANKVPALPSHEPATLTVEIQMGAGNELVPVTKLAAFSWTLLYNIASPVTESYQYVFRKY